MGRASVPARAAMAGPPQMKPTQDGHRLGRTSDPKRKAARSLDPSSTRPLREAEPRAFSLESLRVLDDGVWGARSRGDMSGGLVNLVLSAGSASGEQLVPLFWQHVDEASGDASPSKSEACGDASPAGRCGPSGPIIQARRVWFGGVPQGPEPYA